MIYFFSLLPFFGADNDFGKNDKNNSWNNKEQVIFVGIFEGIFEGLFEETFDGLFLGLFAGIFVII